MSAPPPQPGHLNQEAIGGELRRFLDVTLSAARLELKYRIDWRDPAGGAQMERPEVVVAFDGRDSDLLLERSAELLKALEHVAVRWLKLDRQFHDRVRFDCGNYLANRLAELTLSAQVAAQRVRETRQPFRFNPMTARERRVIHLTLKDQQGVHSSSEGAGEQRRVVVFPAEAR